VSLPSPYWQSDDGRHVIYCADCLSILPHLTGVDAVVTDPQYGVDEAYASGKDDSESVVLALSAIDKCRKIASRVILTPGVTHLFSYPRPTWTGSFYYPAGIGCSAWGFVCWQPILFYGKDPFLADGKGSQPDSKQSSEPAEKNGHPCPKPIGQWTWLVTRTTRYGETVADCFMGSGTTGVACIRTGRRFIGVEIEPKYCAIAVERMERELAQPCLPTMEPERTKQEVLL
jgi:site-specific DNA-methyltransferase (adenine-specific)